MFLECSAQIHPRLSSATTESVTGAAKDVVLCMWSALLCGSSVVHCIEWTPLFSYMCCSLIVIRGTCAENTGSQWAVSQTVPATYLCSSATILAGCFPSFNVCSLYKDVQAPLLLHLKLSCSAVLANGVLDSLIFFEAFRMCSNILRCSENISVSIWKST